MITVFTPTYNRGYIIKELYTSLRVQTSKNFEWLVIDDESNDNTESLFQEWMAEENEFDIVYKRVKHGGKHRAINIASQLAKGEAFFFVDSDDRLTKHAIEKIEEWFAQIADNDNVAGVSGLIGNNEFHCIGGNGNGELYVEITVQEREKYNLLGDKAEACKTEIMKAFPFPEYEGEDFLVEGVFWNALSMAGLKLRYYSEIIYLAEYRTDGLTMQGQRKFINNPKGWLAFIKSNEPFIPHENVLEEYLLWYICVKKRISKAAVCDKYEIGMDVLQSIQNHYHNMVSKLECYFRDNQIKKIAIYGMGKYGTVFLLLEDELSVQICYGIDQKDIRSEVLTVYQRTKLDSAPAVDAVIITMQNREKEIDTFLADKYRKVIFWKDFLTT